MKKCFIVVAAAFVLVFALPAFAVNPIMISKGQTVLVPATWIDITSTDQLSSSRLVIRNIDQTYGITVNAVMFIDGNGHITKNLLDGRDCAGNPNGGPFSVTLSRFQSTSFVTSETTVCVPRFPQSDVGRPMWLVDWTSANRGKDVIAPSIGATIDILTPTYIYGYTGPPFLIVDAESSVAGTVVFEH